jgi:hypothetical protein
MFLSFNFLSALAISMPQAETPAFRKQQRLRFVSLLNMLLLSGNHLSSSLHFDSFALLWFVSLFGKVAAWWE